MKFIIKIIAISILMTSCNEKEVVVGNTLQDKQYKIISFKSQTVLDLDNDGTSNINMLLEFKDFNSFQSYDLRILFKNEGNFYSFSFPRQYIDYNNFVDFSAYGYSLNLENGTDIIENYDLDDESKIILFYEILDSHYKLKFKKKYFDFNTNQFVSNEFEIEYELINN